MSNISSDVPNFAAKVDPTLVKQREVAEELATNVTVPTSLMGSESTLPELQEIESAGNVAKNDKEIRDAIKSVIAPPEEEIPEELINVTRDEIIEVFLKNSNGVDLRTYVRARVDSYYKKEIVELRRCLREKDTDPQVARQIAQADAYGEMLAFLKGEFKKLPAPDPDNPDWQTDGTTFFQMVNNLGTFLMKRIDAVKR